MKNPKNLEDKLGSFAPNEVTDGPVHLSEEEGTGARFIIYSNEKGIDVRLRYEGDGFWMTQSQMTELFGRDQSVISRHVNNVLEEGELAEDSNMQKVHIAGATRPVNLHSLDMIISVGYRVSSAQAPISKMGDGCPSPFRHEGVCR